jgi:phage gpG-like protein
MNPTPIASGIIKSLRDKLDHPEDILQGVGGMLVSQAKQAFRDQKFGDEVWPPRYPNQSAPKVNVAGVLSDINAGRAPKSRRFEDRPALMDIGDLQKSITPSIEGTTVTHGSSLPYAQVSHAGGISTQDVHPFARIPLANFLRNNKQYRKKLGFLFHVPSLTTHHVPRPFIGLTDETEAKIVRLMEDFFGCKAEVK